MPNYSINYTKRNIVSRNCQKLQDAFTKQLSQHQNRYPRYPTKVRFTQEECDYYFKNSVKIVQNFVEKEQIKDWVFDQYHLIYEDYD